MSERESALIARQDGAQLLEQVVVQGDLSKLTPEQRVMYYRNVCESLGLNPYTKPFDYIVLNGRLTLYAKRDCTDQLRRLHKISIDITSREKIDDLYIVTARASMPDGRTDESVGTVSLAGLKGDAVANGVMKAETKAKRRVTLSIVGLGWLDESEVSSIGDAQPAGVDLETGEIAQPVERSRVSSPSEQITDAQRRKLYAMSRERGLTKEQMQDILQARYGVRESHALTKQQAHDLIEYLSSNQ